MSYCGECGNKLDDNVKFCGRCGNKLFQKENSEFDAELIPRELKRKKCSVVHFATGACRYDASKSPIPGSRELTNDWGAGTVSGIITKLSRRGY